MKSLARLVDGLILLALLAPGLAGPALSAPEESLPIYLTPDELTRLDEIGIGQRATEPPPAVPRNCAEWEPVTGVLIRYPLGLPWDLIRDLADHTTVHCLVSSGSQSSAISQFTSNGVNMSSVEWLVMPTNSYWVRDYGPWFVFDGNGDQAISDHVYNRPRPDDDQVNWNLGPIWGIEVYGHDLRHTGGNYMTDGHGISFSSSLVWDENASLSHSEIDAIMYDFLGIETYNVLPDVTPSGIRHIDCWAKLLDEETVLVKQVAPTHADYQRCENNAATIATLTSCYGRPYRVVRVYCPSIGGSSVASYTNSLILGGRVYVPVFNRPEDADALAVYEAAMPGYEIVGYDGSWLSDDAIHCRAKGVMDQGMLYVDHAPVWESEYGQGDVPITAAVTAYSGAALVTDSLNVFWRLEGESSWSRTTLSATAVPGEYETTIPEQPPYTTVEYYVRAMDMSFPSSRETTRPWTAPAGFYSLEFVPGAVDVASTVVPPASITLAPNPFRPRTTIGFDLDRPGPVTLRIFDADGRLVDEIVSGESLAAGPHRFIWGGVTSAGRPVAPGVYLFRLETGGQTEVRRAVRLR